MVRTRQSGSIEDNESSELILLEAQRRQRSIHDLQDDDDSILSGYIPPRKRRRGPRLTRSSVQHKTTNSTRSSLRRCTRKIKEEDDDDDDDDAEDEEEEEEEIVKIDSMPKANGLVNGIRRSTRQRKVVYDTLNQSWILGTKNRDFPNFEDSMESGKFGKLQNQEDGDYVDMYTRVKRQSRKAVRNLYGMNKNKKDSDDDTDDSGGDGEFEDGMDDLQQSRLRPENDQWDTKSSEEDTQDETTAHPKYYLRQKKPIINRFQVPIEPIRTRKVTSKSVFHTSPPRRRNKKFRVFRSPAHKSPLFQRRRHATHNSSTSSSSSSSSSSEDEHRFERRKAKSMAKARSRCMPMNFATEELTKGLVGERVRIGSSLADVDPMNINRSITFDCVGGLSKHVEALKEMILFPLMYPEVFAKFSITPPRGVLFYGPPGTGKTLVARALANECSRGNDKVAFFMRKGADCLSKWVGESERQLRLLFDQAYCMRPSIIFFDEIDGLAPVRSSRQDQIHSSIVSTLLALMDGLDSRGEVVVVGATNRIDAIDPALRRPGRFDREFLFSLPSVHARKSILKIHTKDWVPQLSSAFLSEIAEKTVGYCGADLKALCAEAALFALKRRYPQIYSSREKFKLDVSSIRVEAKDFIKAMAHIVPAGQRSVTSPGRALSAVIQPLLQKSLNKVLKILSTIFPYSATLPSVNCGSDETRSNLASSESESDDEPNICIYEDGDKCNLENSPNCKLKKSNLVSTSKRLLFSRNIYHRPRLLLAGKADQGQSIHLAPAILHGLEHIPVHKLDLSTLFAVTAKAPEESCAQVFHEARRTLPSIVFLPYISRWWGTLNETVQATFLTMLNDLEPSAPLLLLATSECCYDELPLQIQQLFSTYQGEVIEMQNPSRDERHEFFLHLIMQQTVAPPRIKRKHNELEKLPVAEVPEKRVFSETELKKLEEQEENTLRELRLFLREILYKLARERRFSVFRKPVDISEVPDYLDVVQHPMDLETMMMKVDTHQYQTVDQFLKDIELISFNALEYNPDRDPSDKSIRHRACALSDAAHVLVKTELDPEFDQMCKEIYESRQKRGGPFNKFGPINYHTIPKPRRLEAGSDQPTGSNESQSTPRDTSETTKRFSRRLRGMSVPTSPTVAANNPQRKAVKPTVPPGSEIKFRRKRSYWFGSCKRRIVRRIITDDSTNDSIIPETKKDHAAGRDNQKEENVNMDKETELTSSFECDKESPKSHCSQSNHCSGISSNLQNNRSPTNSTDRFSLDDHHRPSSFSKGFSPNRSSSSFNLTPNNSPTAVNAHSDFSSVETVNSKDKPSQTNCGDCLSSNTQCHSGNAGEKVPIHNTPEPPREVTVDKDHLKWILDAIVKATDDCSVETLEKLYCVLCRCIKKHRKEWDKTNLLKELEAEIERFQRSLVS